MKILIIQTAFIGDVILSTALIEKLHLHFPGARLDFLLRKGNESVLAGHPWLTKVYVFDKSHAPYANLFRLLKQIRQEKYNKVINVQRFASSGLLTALSGAKEKIGFDKNPFSFLFTKAIKHSFEQGLHEIARNQLLITHFTDALPAKPRLYPLPAAYDQVRPYQQGPYLCIAPASVWFTKQYPPDKWADLLRSLPVEIQVYILGGREDEALCTQIQELAGRRGVAVLAGKLGLLASAALIQGALMNYVNDSAPMHLASAMNAPTCAVYCSTVPRFGFGPLSDTAIIVEHEGPLYCRPCGLHGYRACPEGHFRCALDIETRQLRAALSR